MTRRMSTLCAGAMLAALAAMPGVRAEAEAEAYTETLSELSENMAAVQSLETRFTQEKHLSVLDHTVTLEGKMYLGKPGRFAWHVFSPIRYSLVMKGDTVRQWDGESGDETRLSLRDNPAMRVAIDQMQQWYLGDYVRLRSEYRVALVEEQPATLTFEPLEDNVAARYIERVTVRFRDDQRYVDEILVQEKDDDRTRIRFHDTKLDREIPSEAWEVRRPPPAGN